MMENVTENNRLIAEFMGLHPNKHDGGRTFAEKIYTDNNGNQYALEWIYPDYETNWNSLMTVVEKIERLGFNFNIEGRSDTIWKIIKEQKNGGYVSNVNISATNMETLKDFSNAESKGNKYFNTTYYNNPEDKKSATYEAAVHFIEWCNDNQNPQPNESN